jgi:hypothetical protein
MNKSPFLPSFALLMTLVPPSALAADTPKLTVELGPISGVADTLRTVSFQQSARPNSTVFDLQDGKEHSVRGLSLKELLVEVGAPKKADTAVFKYTDGMEIPVSLSDQKQIEAIFIAFQHGNAMEQFSSTYPVANRMDIPCPKVVYSRKADASYSIWLYPTELKTVQLVTWKIYEARLVQPTRKVPDRSGWKLYLQHCQSCHGIGGQGAKRGPDFLSHMEAYRRVPPLAITDRSQHPSLHEKVKGFTEGAMPVLNHIPNKDIAILWRWLHTIHQGATK